MTDDSERTVDVVSSRVVVCALCDTINDIDSDRCEECGHNPHMERGGDACHACRVLGYSLDSRPPSTEKKKDG